MTVASLWPAGRHCRMVYHGPCPSPNPMCAGAK